MMNNQPRPTPRTLAEADQARAHLNAVRHFHQDLTARLATHSDPVRARVWLADAEADILSTLVGLSDGGWI